jgi:hypothetical protein
MSLTIVQESEYNNKEKYKMIKQSRRGSLDLTEENFEPSLEN